MIRKFLLFSFVLVTVAVLSSCNNTTEEVEYYLSDPLALLYSRGVTDRVVIVDGGYERMLLFSPGEDELKDLVEGDGMSGVPFPEGMSEFLAGAVGREGIVAVYGDGETEETYFQPLTYDTYVGGLPEMVRLGVPSPQKIFYHDGRWGFIYSDHIDFYTGEMTYETQITLPVANVWRRVKVGTGGDLLLIPEKRKQIYVVGVTEGSVDVLDVDFIPLDGSVTDRGIFLVGGSVLYYVDTTTGAVREKRFEDRYFEYASSGSGNVLDKYDGEFFGVVSGRGNIFFVRPDLCFVSRYEPSVSNQYFVDVGDPSDPELDIEDFSSCIGDVPDDTFTLYYGAKVYNGTGYVQAVTSDSCFEASTYVRWDQTREGDSVIVSGAGYFKTYTLMGGSGNVVCVKEHIEDDITGMEFVIRMNGYGLYSSKSGYIGRMERDGELNLGYMTIRVKDGDKPVTFDDYFVFTLTSGMDPITLEPVDYAYMTYSNVLYSYPAGFTIIGDRAYILYRYSPLFGVVSVSSGESLTQVR